MGYQFNEEQTKFLRQEFTLKGRIFFPNLLKLKKKDKPEDRDLYDTMFAWRPEENAAIMGQINSFLGSAMQLAHNGINPAVIIPPIKASRVPGYPEYLKQNGQPNAEYLAGHLFVNASTGKDFPPGVFKNVPGVGPVRLTENDNADVYSGRNAVISVSFWPYAPEPGDRNQKRGFYVNVKAVLLLDGGDQVGGAAQVDPNAVFGSFLGDMQAAPAFGGYGQPAPAAPVQPAPAWNQPAPAAPAPIAPAWGAPTPGNAPAPASPVAPPYAPAPGYAAPASAPPTTFPFNHAAPAAAPTQPQWPPQAAPNFNPGQGR